MLERMVGVLCSVLYLCVIIGFTEALWANTSRNEQFKESDNYTEVLALSHCLCTTCAVYVVKQLTNVCYVEIHFNVSNNSC